MQEERIRLFNRRFRAYYSVLCRLAFSYIQDRETCEDIVQDTMVNIWDKKKDRLSEADFGPYVRTAVINRCIDQIRQRQHALSVPLNEKLAESSAGALRMTDESAENAACKADYALLLDEILAQLPPKCRQVFVMSKLEKVKYKEIAIRLNISEKTVENHMSKALKIIRTYRTANTLLLILLTVYICFMNNL